jgi:hypothetical protein
MRDVWKLIGWLNDSLQELLPQAEPARGVEEATPAEPAAKVVETNEAETDPGAAQAEEAQRPSS